MKVECIHCGASGQMDETRIPPGVKSIRCPRCKESFPIPEAGTPFVPPPDAAVQETAYPSSAPSLPPELPPPVPDAAVTSSFASTPPPIAEAPAPQTTVAPMANCSVCSRQFPRDEMVRFGTIWVCAACKPGYVQMLAQGKPRPGVMRYAGFWIRFGAKFLDGIILWVVSLLLSLAAGFIMPKTSPQLMLASTIILSILQIAIAVAYSGYFLGTYRATPGKMACGLEVLSPDGGQISISRGAGRYFAEILSGMIFGIGYLMVAFDEEKRSLHDRICNTRVVYK